LCCSHLPINTLGDTSFCALIQKYSVSLYMYVFRYIYMYILLVILPTIPPVALHFAHAQKLQKKNQDHKDNGAGDGTPSGNHFA